MRMPVALSLVAITWLVCQPVSSTTDLSPNLVDAFSNLPQEFPAEWVERCGEGNKDIPFLKKRVLEFEHCRQNKINVTDIPQDFASAVTDNIVQDYIREQCQNIPGAVDCVTKFVQDIEKCFDDSQKEVAWISVRAMRAVADFICYRDGERVLIFIKDDGIECFMEQKDGMEECVKNIRIEDLFNGTYPNSVSFLSMISYTENSCRHIINMTTCMVDSMKKCSNRTPSNVLYSLVKAVLEETPCWDYAKPSSAHHNFANKLLVVLLFVVQVTFLMTGH